MKNLAGIIISITLLMACSAGPTTIPTSIPVQDTAIPATITPAFTQIPSGETPQPEITGTGGCRTTPGVAPTKPAIVPPSLQLDTTTGLHMTGFPQELDLGTYHLKVSGKVDHALNLTFDELRCLPKVTAAVKLSCPGIFVDSATWAGVPIVEVLVLAGMQSDMKDITLVGADGYSATISREQALNRENFLAYEQQGQLLPILHGFPLRGVFPDMAGSFWVKWLVEIVVN